MRAELQAAGRSWRRPTPWIVSAGLLVYVFGYATEWHRLLEALDGADMPRFLLFATADRLAYFVIWTWLSALALQRFVADVPTRSVFAIRGGSELARAVSNPLSDAAYLLGLSRLAGGRVDAVLASALVPIVTHLFVMLVQMTLALPLQSGGLARSPVLTAGLAVTWMLVAIAWAWLWALRRSRLRRPIVQRIDAWLARFPLRQLLPFLWGFAILALFDVHIQWLASRAFGLPIEWTAMAARLPVLYLTFLVPTLGNFGTREVAWAGLFGEFGDRDHLIAYAFAVNAVFLVLNVLIGVVFLSRALRLVGAPQMERT